MSSASRTTTATKTADTKQATMKTSLPEVIWEEGRVAAKVSPHTGYNGAPQIRPKNTPSRRPIPKPH